MKSPVLTRIMSYQPAFTTSERKAAQIVIERPEEVIYFSVTELAEKAKIGETTVLRFCKKLGFKGYQDFKLALAKDNFSQEQGETKNNEDPIQAMVQHVTSSHIQGIEETISLIHPEAVEKAVQALVDCEHLLFTGVGTSGITALDAKSRFLRIGIRSESMTDTHFQLMTASMLTEKDAVVAFTVSGSSVDTVNLLKLAKENGATTIAITQFARSPITKFADIVLLTSGREAPLEGGSLAAKIAQLAIVDILCTGVGLKQKERSLYYKEKTAEAVVDKIF